MIKYKIDIIKELVNKGYNTNRIRKEKILSQSTMTNIRKGESISLQAINDICIMLRCQPGDIIEIVPSNEEKIKFF